MQSTDAPKIAPRYEPGRTFQLAGFQDHFTVATRNAIPALWGRFIPEIGRVPGQVDGFAFGVVTNANPGGFHYMAGVEVATFLGLPDAFSRVVVSAPRFVVFTHVGNLSTLLATFEAIFGRWLPELGVTPADAPCFERYSPDFCAETGTGTLEIWVPIIA
jgi:AraC family transcriptional regulator